MEIKLRQLDLTYEKLHVADSSRQSQAATALASHGQERPVFVIRGEEEGRYRLVDGFFQVRALRALGRDVVEVRLLEMGAADALLFCYELRERGRATALEEGWLIRELLEGQGMSQGELAAELDRSVSWVSRRLALVRQLPESVQEQARAGRLCVEATMRYLVPLAQTNPDDCGRLVERLGSSRVSFQQMGALYTAWKSAHPSERAKILDRPLLYLKTEKELSHSFLPCPGPVDTDELLIDIGRVADLCYRIQMRLHEVNTTSAAEIPFTLEDCWKRTYLAFEFVDGMMSEAFHAHP